jgi:hypothetical protein
MKTIVEAIAVGTLSLSVLALPVAVNWIIKL